MAVDKSVVAQQLRDLEHLTGRAERFIGALEKFQVGREIGHLHEVLVAGEVMKAFVKGVYDKKTWLVVVTDRRLLFLDKGMLGLKTAEIPFAHISAMSHTIGIATGEITVSTASGRQQITMIQKQEMPRLVDVISGLIHAASRPQPIVIQQASTNGSDVATQLEKLADLKAKGVLTDAEFQAQKTKLLGG